MKVHPAIAALRGNRAAQRLNQEPISQAHADWLSSAPVAQVIEAMANYAAGAPLAQCPSLSDLLHDTDMAGAFVRAWSARFASALSHAPLGEAPFRYRLTGGAATVHLMRSGRATLAATAIPRGEALEGAKSVVIADRESHEILIEGRASGAVYMLNRQEERPHVTKAGWCAGDQIAMGPRSARLITNVEQSVLLLQLSRTAEHPTAAREFDSESGQFHRSASGDKLTSRKVMALSVLGALEHRDALPVLGDVARDAWLDNDLRWEAVRQTLALDSASGMRLLNDLAEQSPDALAQPAARLRSQLLGAYPQLALCDRKAA